MCSSNQSSQNRTSNQECKYAESNSFFLIYIFGHHGWPTAIHTLAQETFVFFTSAKLEYKNIANIGKQKTYRLNY